MRNTAERDTKGARTDQKWRAAYTGPGEQITLGPATFPIDLTFTAH